MNDVPMKRCPRCKEEFPATTDYFHGHTAKKDHLCSYCKTCSNAINVNNRVLKKAGQMKPKPVRTKEYWQEYNRQRYQAKREDIQVVQQQYKSLYPDRVKLTKARYAQSVRGKERRNVNINRYRKTELGRIRQVTANRNRRAKIKAAPGKHTVADIQAQHERQKGKCFYCKKKLGTGKYAYHVDHVIPLAKGGTNDPSNLVITCPACNLHKNVHIYTLF
jgi:5-methylcytosine-specific restriction endonuclease McrA